MILWWIGNAVLLLVVAPVVVWLAHAVYVRTKQIAELAERIGAGGAGLAKTLDDLPALLATRDLARTARLRVTRYGQALEKAL